MNALVTLNRDRYKMFIIVQITQQILNSELHVCGVRCLIGSLRNSVMACLFVQLRSLSNSMTRAKAL